MDGPLARLGQVEIGGHDRIRGSVNRVGPPYTQGWQMFCSTFLKRSIGTISGFTSLVNHASPHTRASGTRNWLRRQDVQYATSLLRPQSPMVLTNSERLQGQCFPWLGVHEPARARLGRSEAVPRPAPAQRFAMREASVRCLSSTIVLIGLGFTSLLTARHLGRNMAISADVFSAKRPPRGLVRREAAAAGSLAAWQAPGNLASPCVLPERAASCGESR